MGLLLFLWFIIVSVSARGNVTQLFNASDIIDDCCCTVGTLNDANNQYLHSLLSQLTTQTYFKFFKVDLKVDCPFWVQKVLCGLDGQGNCKICECDESEIPIPWKLQTTNFAVFSKPPLDFRLWDDVDENMWCNCEESPTIAYLNLQDNPESNTGYVGPEAGRIWESIYNENCFQGPLQDMCFEERVYFRLISGLHTSISTHKFRRWELDSEKQWKANLEGWKQYILPYPDRLENLYFALLFELRALAKITPQLREMVFVTGNQTEEKRTKELVNELLDSELLCQPTFNESLLFQTAEKAELRYQLKNMFRNVSLIMNCVACEKCKLWGKLQMLGMGTSLKVMLAEDAEVIENLQRNEIVALINSIKALSESVAAVEYFQKLIDKEEQLKETVIQEPETYLTLAQNWISWSIRGFGYPQALAALAGLMLPVIVTMRSSSTVTQTSKKPAKKLKKRVKNERKKKNKEKQ